MDVVRRTWARVAATVVVAVAVLAVVLVVTARDAATPGAAADPEPPSTTTPDARPPTATVDPACAGGATAPFTPRTITVDGVIRHAEVMALPRDANNVPGVPPTDHKDTFAYDEPGIRPGAARGNVLLNAHTWPDGSAAGNALLRELEAGDRIVLRGGGEKLCYDVTERVEVRVEDGYPPYYDTEGRPQLAIVVCSGERRGPGDWSHRTLWFASPVT